jgi:hypothetical protein
MSVLNKIIKCYNKEFARPMLGFPASRSNSETSTVAPSLNLNNSPDIDPNRDLTEDEFMVRDIFENMRRLALKRRYDGAHVRKGDKLILNV